MTRRGVFLAILLVSAFLAHDGWMVVAHGGHIVYATPDDAPAMGEHPHAGHHAPATSGVPQIDEAAVSVDSPMLPMTMRCATIRAGTLGQPSHSPSPAVSLAVLPIPNDVTEQTDRHGHTAWRPPGQSPDVRRAFLQVYRE